MSMIIIDLEGDVILKFDPALIVDRHLEAWAETASLVGMPLTTYLSRGHVSHSRASHGRASHGRASRRRACHGLPTPSSPTLASL
jgi:hypothetical protein